MGKFKYSEKLFNNRSAQIVLEHCFSLFGAPGSFLDIGCGIGNWTHVAKELGVKEVLGIDNATIVGNTLQIDEKEYKSVNLNEPFELNRQYDMAISLEVGEHIKEDASEAFVSSICHHTDLVIFSAALPGQTGYRHINEQWPQFWVELFKENGFSCIDILRDYFWDDPRIHPWYRQNIFIYTKREELIEKYGKTNNPHVKIHPDIFVNNMAQAVQRIEFPKLNFSLKLLARALMLKIGYQRKGPIYSISMQNYLAPLKKRKSN